MDAEFGNATAGRPDSVFPHIMLDRAKPGLIAVNGSGRRFVNEANSYHDFVEAMLRSQTTGPEHPSYLICDRSFIRDYGLGLNPSRHPRSRSLYPVRLSISWR